MAPDVGLHMNLVSVCRVVVDGRPAIAAVSTRVCEKMALTRACTERPRKLESGLMATTPSVAQKKGS